MKREYRDLTLDEERALYGTENALVAGCLFAGPADGESALKECRDLDITDCTFQLRYPLWHVTRARVSQCGMTDTCRAALWYDEDIQIRDCELLGIKALRECNNILLEKCKIESSEFGWFCKQVQLSDCSLISEYPFLQSRDIEIENLTMQGKYSFQYVENMVIRNSNLDTKDAFWHCNHVTVIDSVIKGEYLAWYSKDLKLIRCKIIGTQPLCYAEDLVLEDCEMVDCDLAFENSRVKATVKGEILSVKNPISGYIQADAIGQVILDSPSFPGEGSRCEIVQRKALPVG